MDTVWMTSTSKIHPKIWFLLLCIPYALSFILWQRMHLTFIYWFGWGHWLVYQTGPVCINKTYYRYQEKISERFSTHYFLLASHSSDSDIPYHDTQFLIYVLYEVMLNKKACKHEHIYSFFFAEAYAQLCLICYNRRDRNISTIPAEELKMKCFDSIQFKRPTNIFPIPTNPLKSDHAVESSGTVSIWEK